MVLEAVSRMPDKRSPRALEDLFRDHSELVYRTAYSIVNNVSDAEDVVQNVFLQLARRQLPPGLARNTKGYLYRAAINASLNTIRSKRRYELVGDSEGLDGVANPPDLRENEQPHRHLAQALAELKPEAVHILVLRYVHGYSDAHIAKLLGTSRTVIAVRLFRSRARLKTLLRDMGEK